MEFLWRPLMMIGILAGTAVSQGCTPPPGAQNLALGRPATQTSTYDNEEIGKAVAGKAVDGKRDGKWLQGSCSHTQLDTEPWWNVDLGSRQSVSAVIVKNREDCCGERLEGAQIRVGDAVADHGKHDPICGTITDTRPGSLSTICCNGLEGRYVTVTIPGRAEYLTVCEVEVYGTQLGDKC
ncbi:fucolectin-like [Mauremys reevesii]|uniref:fucolectin-like n=1 Tax=Mauremys reevesii TaxID=260615 RepID=UPI00193F6076|nr:fucolectin-like [Mauremys reevesii]XP_039382141.1 fucolectin-like [Mauremys reevesii]